MPGTSPSEAEELQSLPFVLSGCEVAAYLEPYGYLAHTPLDWKNWTVPELTIKVTGHSYSGGHTLYNLECSMWRPGQRRRRAAAAPGSPGLKSAECESSSSLSTAATSESTGASEDVAEADEPPWLSWCAARRLAHLREGLHDSVKRQLGSSYETYFCRVPFAHRLRPSGTTARLDAWCSRLAYCISTKLVPPGAAAETLRLLGAPDVACRARKAEPSAGHGGYAGASPSSEADSFARFTASLRDLPEIQVEPELFVSRREKLALPKQTGELAEATQLAAQRPGGPGPVRKHAIDIQLPGLEDESDGEGGSARGSIPSGAASDDSGDEHFEGALDDRFAARLKSKDIPPDGSNPFV